MHYVNNTELSSHEETRCQFNGSKAVIKLGIDVPGFLCRGDWGAHAPRVLAMAARHRELPFLAQAYCDEATQPTRAARVLPQPLNRFRLGRLKFLFQSDRIDQIAPAAAGRIGVRAAGNRTNV